MTQQHKARRLFGDGEGNAALPGPGRLLARYILSMVAWRLASAAMVLLVWTGLSLLSGGRLPSPLDALRQLAHFIRPGLPAPGLTPDLSLLTHAGASALRAYGGLVISLFLFLPLGILLGAKRLSYYSTIGVIEFLRSVPAFMLILVLLSLHVTGEWGRMACVVFAVGVLLTDYAASAMRNMPADRIEILRAMRANPWQLFWKAMWVPLLLNAVLPTLRIGVGVAVIIALVVETLVQPQTGLGVLINAKLGQVNVEGGLALILVAGFLGWVGNFLVSVVSDVLWWVFAGRPLTPVRPPAIRQP